MDPEFTPYEFIDNDGIYNPIDLNGNGVWDPDEDRPDIIGDQVAWCVFNDAVMQRLRFQGVPPLGIEIHQTVFLFPLFFLSCRKDEVTEVIR